MRSVAFVALLFLSLASTRAVPMNSDVNDNSDTVQEDVVQGDTVQGNEVREQGTAVRDWFRTCVADREAQGETNAVPPCADIVKRYLVHRRRKARVAYIRAYYAKVSERYKAVYRKAYMDACKEDFGWPFWLQIWRDTRGDPQE